MPIKVEHLLLRGASGDPYVPVQHPVSGAGRSVAGNLLLVMVGARHLSSTNPDAPFISHQTGWETVATHLNFGGIFFGIGRTSMRVRKRRS